MRRTSASARRRPDRRGITLVMVMAAVAACLVIAMAFLHAETTALRTLGNARSADRAREAAESGMAALLSDLQSPSWAGIDTVLAAEVGRDGTGAWSYKTKVTAKTGDGTLETALTLSLKSTGTYQAFDSPRPIDRTVKATVRLVPRVPASGTPSDRKPDAVWDVAQAYVFFGRDSGDTLRLPPQAKLVGDVYAYAKPMVYHEVAWSDVVRARAGAERPAPITGYLSVSATLATADSARLTALLGTDKWGYATTPLTLPSVDPAQFSPTIDYRLYERGPTYRSVSIGSSLGGQLLGTVVLGPTAGNPLGIFHRQGSVTLGNNVRVTGTLVVKDNISVEGSGVEIRAVSLPASGRSASLPAIVCGGDVNLRSTATLSATGLIYAGGKVMREAVDREAGTSVTIDGAIVAPYLHVGTPPKWDALSAGDWTNRSGACPTGTAFFPWLASPSNWPLLFWPLTYSLNGLSNEPAFLVTRRANVDYVAAPPLFRPDPAAWNAGGGYRWELQSWHEAD